MKVVIYSTNTNFFDPHMIHINSLPSCAENLSEVIKNNPELKIIIATQLPALFLLDYDSEGNIIKAEGAEYVILKGSTAAEIAFEIEKLSPDLAIASSFWVTPFDWLPLQDAEIAKILENKGIKTISHPVKASLDFFDKKRARDFFCAMGIKTAPSVYVHHQLFWSERGKNMIKNNAYKEAVFNEISKLTFPVVIKDTLGLSSYGMEVSKTFNQTKAFLLSKKASGDRLVEEYLSGLQFGTEIHGMPGHYTVFPPFMFSTNQYGITSPKQSVKIGPVTDEKFKISELKKLLTEMAEKIRLKGIAQVDLVFHNSQWYVIEVNPRLSGMSQTIAASSGKHLMQLLLDNALQKNNQNPEMKMVFDMKFPILTENQQKKLFNLPFVLYLQQTFNEEANQHREMGFCEVIFGGRNSREELKEDLEEIKNRFPEILEPVFYENALKMLEWL